ncbi:hypothetical protein FJY63_04125 [Candidatus Sumerlaeota bacterium]|nr:hypothetical protein [Candidatus Sumerlaeota bacterium]
MEVLRPHYSRTQFAERGQSIYQEKVKPYVTDRDEGKFVAIDIETGDYEMDSDDYGATERLLQRQPTAQIWLVRIGDGTTYRIGGYQSGKRS